VLLSSSRGRFFGDEGRLVFLRLLVEEATSDPGLESQVTEGRANEAFGVGSSGSSSSLSLDETSGETALDIAGERGGDDARSRASDLVEGDDLIRRRAGRAMLASSWSSSPVRSTTAPLFAGREVFSRGLKTGPDERNTSTPSSSLS
jgi:hypothetical protein